MSTSVIGDVEVSVEVGQMRQVVTTVAAEMPGDMGLHAGLRPAADVTALLAVAAAAECALARRLHAAQRAGALPLAHPGAMATAQGWSPASARRLARTGAFICDHPTLARTWAAGTITSEHVDALARRADRLSTDQMDAVVAELEPHWGQLTPAAAARFVDAAIRLIHPPGEPQPDEQDAYTARALSFAVLGDTILLDATLPRLEGEAVMAAIDALADRLRCQHDTTPASARRADALVQLVNDAHATGTLPTRGGLPTTLTVTMHHLPARPVATTARGHLLTDAENRFVTCDATITPVLLDPPPAPAANALAALAAALLDQRQPLAVGRTHRTATTAQRRALALRDRGCVIPGCGVPPEACQTHHLHEWDHNGSTDLDNLLLLCWTHHRQVDLHKWHITPKHQPPPPGTLTWPANNAAPWTIHTQPRHRWRP